MFIATSGFPAVLRGAFCLVASAFGFALMGMFVRMADLHAAMPGHRICPALCGAHLRNSPPGLLII